MLSCVRCFLKMETDRCLRDQKIEYIDLKADFEKYLENAREKCLNSAPVSIK